MRYRAFISYSSADRAIGERFQRAIERFKIPRSLRGQDHGFGPVPTRLTPLFRDRSDADAGRSLADTLHEALQESEALVVLCSPASAASRWVNDEILSFKRLGRGARIFPVLLSGEPRRHDSLSAPNGAFPPALFQRVDAAGAVIAEDDPEPLAPDVRETGDGLHYARLKLIAALTGVPLTVLAERAHQAERRERLIIRAVAFTMATLAVIAGVAAVVAVQQAEAARRRLEAAIEMASRRVDDAARYRDEYGVPTPVIRQLLTGAERDFGSLIGDDQTPTLQLQRGRLYSLFSGLYGAVGEGDKQIALAERALATLDHVPAARDWRAPGTWFARLPSPAAVADERLSAIEALGTALSASDEGVERAGQVLAQGRALAHARGNGVYEARFLSLEGERAYSTGDLPAALAAHQAAQTVLQGVIAKGGDDADDARRDLAESQSDAAEMLLELERPREALTMQSTALTGFEAAAARAPNDAGAKRALAQAITREADIRYAISGDWRDSIPDFERARSVFQAISDSDPARIDYARDLSISLERLGDARLQLGDFDVAQSLFDQSIGIRREILARDPSDPEAQRDLAVALERQADIAMAARHDARASLVFLDEARALRSRSLATAGESGDILQAHDLAILWGKTGDARAAAARPDWTQAYDTAITTLTPLIEDSNAPPGWLRDLAVFHASYADALSKRHDADAALAHWRAAYDLIQRELRVSPDDPRLRQDAATLRARIAQ